MGRMIEIKGGLTQNEGMRLTSAHMSSKNGFIMGTLLIYKLRQQDANTMAT
jgi:hypothetical protein